MCSLQWYPLEGVDTGELHVKLYWMSLTRDTRDLEYDEWEREWIHANRPMHSAILMCYVDHASDLPVSLRTDSLLAKASYCRPLQFPKVKLEPSPIIELSIGQDKQCTLPKFKTINPMWQEKFFFFVSHPENQDLLVEVGIWLLRFTLYTCTYYIIH